MNVHFKMMERMRLQVIADLERPHNFATERLGFLRCKVAWAKDELLILASHYEIIPDDQYVDDSSAGCYFGERAMRAMLQYSLTNHESIFHIHLHYHSGLPQFSQTDLRESAQYVPDFWHVTPDLPHGTIVLSRNRAFGRCWYPESEEAIDINRITSVGPLVRKLGGKP